jgi:hypothetical protein
MQTAADRAGEALVATARMSGHAVPPLPTPLTRLNYFDGKFLRAADLQAEQEYLRTLVALSNQGGGSGVVHGFDTLLKSGDSLAIGAGLAIDPAGRVLLLPRPLEVGVQVIIDKSRAVVRAAAEMRAGGSAEFEECLVAVTTPPGEVLRGSDLYLITIAHAEWLCGTEAVYGKICEEACATTTDRPQRLEGIVVRALPLVLRTPLVTSGAVALDRRHLRSRVASAYYADEQRRAGSLISRAGLARDTWCLGARAAGGQDVPLAVVAREGATTVFLDAWIARRERIEAPARRYWAGRMAMRPWDVFLAQVLQFQCQLHDLFDREPTTGKPDDPCEGERKLIAEAYEALGHVEIFYKGVVRDVAAAPALAGGLTQVGALKTRMLAIKNLALLGPKGRVLIQGGIVELPPAGYLPVTPGETASVNAQVHRLMGEGVDLRFCIVRPDFVAHALEEAQHLERISLLEGLDYPERRPRVDILVPDGRLVKALTPSVGTGFEGLIKLTPGTLLTTGKRVDVLGLGDAPLIRGAGRGEPLPGGGGAFHFAGATEARNPGKIAEVARGLVEVGRARDAAHLNLLRTFAPPAGTKPSAVPESIDAGVFTRLSSLATEAARKSLGARAKLDPFDPAAAAQPLAEFTPTVPRNRRYVSLWTTMRCERNPFGLVAGDRSPASLRAVLAIPAANPTLLDLEIHGDFEIAQTPAGGPGERRVNGWFTGLASLRSVVDGAAAAHRTGSVRLSAALVLRTPADEPPSIEIVLTHVVRRTTWTIQASWSGRPLQVQVEVAYAFGAAPVPLAAGNLTDNPAVLLAGNPVHALALAALDIVGAALADPGFTEATQRILFPPPPAPSEETSVRATLDWVLFHRRRDIDCGAREARLLPAPPRRYQLYHLGVTAPAQAAAVRKALMSGSAAAIARLKFAPVDVVEFAGGAPTLTSPAEALRVDWQRVQPGNLIVYAAIGSQGPALGDGPALASGRLARLEAALAPLSTLAPSAISETLSVVPAPLAVTGTDGIVVMLTMKRVETTCQDVYRVENDDVLKQLVTQIGAGRIVEGLARLAVRLGMVEFAAGTTTVHDNSTQPVVAAWAARGGGVPGRVVTVARNNEPAVTLTLFDGQARAVVQALGANRAPARALSPAALPSSCPSIALVVPVVVEPRVGRLYVFARRGDSRGIIFASPELQMRFDPTGAVRTNDGQWATVLDRLRDLRFQFRRVELATREVPTEAQAQARLDGMVAALRQAALLASGATSTLTTLTAAEQPLLTADGIRADDVIFLERHVDG